MFTDTLPLASPPLPPDGVCHLIPAADFDKTMPAPRSPMSPSYGIAPSTGGNAKNDLEVINQHLENQIAVSGTPPYCPVIHADVDTHARRGSSEAGGGRGHSAKGYGVRVAQL